MTAKRSIGSVRGALLWTLVVVAMAGVAGYWLFFAADRYVSQARVVLQRSDLSTGQAVDFAGLIQGSGGGNRTEQLWLREHLLSQDMLRRADAALGLRAHYSGLGDWWTRLPSADAPIELFHEHFRERVSVELNEFAGVLYIDVQAYTPEMAHALASFMVRAGEESMNRMGHALAQEQVQFLEQQVTSLGKRVQSTRKAVLAFQNRNGMLSPMATSESLAAVVARLDAQLSQLQTRRRALMGYLQAGAPNVVEIDMQIAATEQQIRKERARLAAPGGRTLNATLEAFQSLQLEAEFAQEVFKTALVALEKGRVEATRTLKKLTVLQNPSLPEYPIQPRRAYNALVYCLLILLVAGVAHLLLAIVRDHQD